MREEEKHRINIRYGQLVDETPHELVRQVLANQELLRFSYNVFGMEQNPFKPIHHIKKHSL
jgi:hypothetical protein